LSGPPPLDIPQDPGFLGEELCGLPTEAAEGPGLLGMVPFVSHWMNSSAATTGGKVADTILGGAAGIGLGKVLGWVLHVPVVGSLLDTAVAKITKKFGFEFSLKSGVNMGVRSAVVGAEGLISDRRSGMAKLKAEAQIGKHGGMGQSIFGGN
jgi:hypothetical protein